MNFNDVIGLSFILLVLLCCLYGLYRVSKPAVYTKEEYEKRLKEGSGIARGTMNALMYPLEELLHPKRVAAVHVLKDMKQGYYDVLQQSGQGFDKPGPVDFQTDENEAPRRIESRTSRFSRLLRSVLNVFHRSR